MKRTSVHSLIGKSVLVVLCGTILTVSAHSIYFRKALVPGELKPTAKQPAILKEDVQVEVVSILPNGFEREEIVRPAGRFMLLFDNQSRLQPLEFRVAKIHMLQVAQVRLRGKTESTKILNLSPGDYQVTEANHPNWFLKLTLTGQ